MDTVYSIPVPNRTIVLVLITGTSYTSICGSLYHLLVDVGDDVVETHRQVWPACVDAPVGLMNLIC